MRATPAALVLLCGFCCATGPVAAQSSEAQSFSTSAGQDVRLGAYAVFKPDCSVGAAPQIRPAGDQRGGVLVVTGGILSTTRVPNCARLQAPAQVIAYRPNPGFTGTDLVTYDVVDPATGKTETHKASVAVTP